MINKINLLKQQNIETCNILGVNIVISNMTEISRLFFEKMEEIRGEYVCISNVHTTVMASEDEQYRRVQNEAFLALPDGKPLVLACRKKGFKNAERIAGPDLMPEIIRRLFLQTILQHRSSILRQKVSIGTRAGRRLMEKHTIMTKTALL